MTNQKVEIGQFNPMEINTSTCERKTSVMSAVCGGRNYTWQKGAYQTAQILTIGSLGYLYFATLLNPSENSNLVTDFCIGAVLTLLGISSAREIYHCGHGFRDNKKIFVNPFLLSTAALFGGFLAAQVSRMMAQHSIDSSQVFDQSLSHDYNVVEEAPVKTLLGCASLTAGMSISYEILLRYLKHRGSNQPLLN